MTTPNNLLITVGNVYLDHNAFGINTDGKEILEVGKDYFAERGETVIGGSAVNFAMQAKNLQMPVAFLGRVGDDEDGKEIKRLLQEKGIIDDLVITAKGDITSSAFNMIFSHNGQFVGIHWGNASKKLSSEQIHINNPLLKEAAAIYFGGTAKQEKIFNDFPALFEKLANIGIKIIIDPNRLPVGEKNIQRDTLLDSLKYVDCYLPNEDEIKEVAMEENVDRALETVIKRGVKIVVVKLGAKGCRIKTNSKDIIIPGFQVSPITTVGAGDSFNAGFIVEYLQGSSLEESAKFVNAVATIKVGENKIPSKLEVANFIKEHQEAIIKI